MITNPLAGRPLRRGALRGYNRPVIPLLIALMSGIQAGALWPGHAAAAWPTAVVALSAAVYGLLKARGRRLSPLVLFLAAGYLSIQPWTGPRFPPHHVSRFTGPVRWTVTGTIATPPTLANHRRRFVLAAESIATPGSSIPVVGRLRVSIAGTTPDLLPGHRIRFASRLRSPRNFNNPGGFDYRRYLALEGIWATAFSKGADVTILSGGSPADGCRLLERTREKIGRMIDTAVAAPDSRALLKALVLGDRTGLSSRLQEAFARTGISHVLAISGLHVGIVAAGAFWLLNCLLSFLRPLLWRASARKWAAFLALIPVVSYGVLAGMAPSTQRAVIMVFAFLAAVCLGREQDPLNTLAVAALSILSIHPPALFSVSFQLSFSAVAAIILGMSPRVRPSDPNPGLARAVARKVLGFLEVSALATLGTLPLVMHFFNQVSLVGLPANCIAVPVIGSCVVPLGLLSALVGGLWFQAGAWGFELCGRLLALCLPVIEALAEVALAAIKTVTPTPLEITGYYVLLATGIYLVRTASLGGAGSAPTTSAGAARLPMPRKAAWALLWGALLLLAADGVYWAADRFWHRDLRVTVIDVGQGSAALLEFPNGHVMLVDGGGFSDPAVFDIGARVVAPYLWSRKIRTVDTLVLSHPDADHMNGLLYIAEHFHVRRLWSTGEGADSPAYRRLLDIIRQKGIEHPEFRKLARTHQLGGARLEVLHPPADFTPADSPEEGAARNNHSMVLRVVLGRHAVLLPGDLMGQGEADLAGRRGPQLDSTVLVAPHHGSRTSSTPGFIESVRPEAVIVSATANDRARRPHPTVMARYTAAGADVLCTATTGAVLLRITHDSLHILPFLDD